MTSYLVHTPWWMRMLYPHCIWQMPAQERTVYLTFDDGPHPSITLFVLNELEKYGAKGTFFCIGKNVEKYPQVFDEIIKAGHGIGNHTYNHLNGWKTPLSQYNNDILAANSVINSSLFRPPYGRISRRQIHSLLQTSSPIKKIIMWSVLSGDFDSKIDGSLCATNVVNNLKSGSIVVFHDSEKAFSRLKKCLPIVLDFCKKNNYEMQMII